VLRPLCIETAHYKDPKYMIIHTHAHIYMCIHIHARIKQVDVVPQPLCIATAHHEDPICMCIHPHTHAHTYTHLRTCTHIHTYTSTNIYSRVQTGGRSATATVHSNSKPQRPLTLLRHTRHPRVYAHPPRGCSIHRMFCEFARRPGTISRERKREWERESESAHTHTYTHTHTRA